MINVIEFMAIALIYGITVSAGVGLVRLVRYLKNKYKGPEQIEIAYTMKLENHVTGETKEFHSFKDFNEWYKSLTINDMMNWSGWYIDERSDKYVPVDEKISS